MRDDAVLRRALPLRRLKIVQKKYSRFRENKGKRFFFGVNFLLNGGKADKKKSSVVYGSESTTYPWPDNVNIRRMFSDVLRFCALLMTSLILGGI